MHWPGTRIGWVSAALIAVAAVSYGVHSAAESVPGEIPMNLSSAAFDAMGEIPSKYTCEGEDISPPLRWSGVPDGTVSFALIMDDPDAPDPAAPRMTWCHWVLANLPARERVLVEAQRKFPAGTVQGLNDWNAKGYGGPCPPTGRHRYVHKLYALDAMLNLTRPTKTELEQAMQGHILARAELVGTYEKRKK